jgi:intergrase/recombinase
MDLSRRDLLGFISSMNPLHNSQHRKKTFVVDRGVKNFYMRNHNNNVMLFLKIEEKY